jgi:hypothetical protein
MTSVFDVVVDIDEPVCRFDGQQVLLGCAQGGNWLVGPLSDRMAAFFTLGQRFENAASDIVASWARAWFVP